MLPSTIDSSTTALNPRQRHFWQELLLITVTLILGIAAWSVMRFENTIKTGSTILLELAPVDPRSLMQGDYMIVRYEQDTALRQQLQDAAHSTSATHASYAYLSVDAERRAKIISIGSQPLPPNNATALRIRYIEGRPQLGPNGFFFQEGTAQVYEAARWGELRVTTDGSALLVGLRDADLKPLGINRF